MDKRRILYVLQHSMSNSMGKSISGDEDYSPCGCRENCTRVLQPLTRIECCGGRRGLFSSLINQISKDDSYSTKLIFGELMDVANFQGISFHVGKPCQFI